MPDESCRNCGGVLIENSKCSTCMRSTSMICKICALSTTQQFHSVCMSHVTNHASTVPKVKSCNYSVVVMA